LQGAWINVATSTKNKVEGKNMSRPINDPTGVLANEANVANMAVPTELKQLLDQQTAVNQQLVNLPSSHPSYAALQTRQATLAAAVTLFKPRDVK
jgi:hypothetical protein